MVTSSVDFGFTSAAYEVFKMLGLREDPAAAAGAATYAAGGIIATRVGTAAAGYASAGGPLAIDLIASVVDSYNASAQYSTGWPGGVDVNPHIELSRLAR